jgi:hypothetical protein
LNTHQYRYLEFILFVVLAGMIAGCGSGGMPSDAVMRDRFSRNQQDLITLVQMSNHDQHVVVINPNFTYLDTDVSWPRTNIGFPESRWDEYRNLFRKLGVVGLSRRTDYSPSVFIECYGSGGALASSNKGYVYSENPLSPIATSLNRMPQELYDAKGHAIAFIPLAQDWYIYREEY